MIKVLVKLTDAFYASVREYQNTRNFRSWTQALLTLASIGYKTETGRDAPAPTATWGGKRKKHQDEKQS